MHCEICQKAEATIHLTEIVDGVRSEMHLCELCAQEQGITVKSQMPLNELLSNLLASQPDDDEMSDPSQKRIVCPHCGFSLDEFREEAVLGCPKDYEVFEKELSGLIARAHNGKSHHCGKVPSTTPKGDKEKMEFLNLQKELDAALGVEDYEKAAKLRDILKQKESQ